MPRLIGREAELGQLKKYLDTSRKGHGQTVFITGEAGIGKTALIEEIKSIAEDYSMSRINYSPAISSYAQTAKALAPELEAELTEHDYALFNEVFVVNPAGLLLGHASQRGGKIDDKIFAAMLTAVQDYVKESFDDLGRKGGLGTLEYGDKTLLLEHGDNIYVVGIIRGRQSLEMRADLKEIVKGIESAYSDILPGWSGDTTQIRGIEQYVTALLHKKYLVKQLLDPEATKLQLHARVTAAVKKSSRYRPQLIILEDLHWADTSSLELLRYLARNITDSPVTILATYRPEDLEPRAKDILGKAEGRRIELRPFTQDDTARLAHSVLGDAPPEPLIPWLASQTGGNPLYIKELIRNLQQEGLLLYETDHWRLRPLDEFVTPSSIEDLISRRFNRMSENEIRVAEYAAAIGTEFDPGLLAKAMARAPAEVSTMLAKLQADGLIQPINGSWRFSHQLIADVAYSGMSERARRLSHLAIARVLEAEHAENLEPVLYDLARHYGNTTEYERAIDYNIRAGERAKAGWETDNALKFYKTALKALEFKPDKEKKVNALLRAGELAELVGEWDAGLEYYNKVLQLTDDPKAQAEAHAGLGLISSEKGDIDAMLENYSKAFELYKEAEDEAGIIKASRKIGDACKTKGDYPAAFAFYSEALKRAEKLDNKKEIATVNRAIGEFYTGQQKWEEAIKYFKRCKEIAEATNNTYTLSAVYYNFGALYSRIGKLDEAAKYIESAHEIAKRIKWKTLEADSSNLIADISAKRGDIEKAERYVKIAMDTAKEIGDAVTVMWVLTNYGQISCLKGDKESTYKYYDESWSMAEKIGLSPSEKAALILEYGTICKKLGDREKAKEKFEIALQIYKSMDAQSGIENVQKELENLK